VDGHNRQKAQRRSENVWRRGLRQRRGALPQRAAVALAETIAASVQQAHARSNALVAWQARQEPL